MSPLRYGQRRGAAIGDLTAFSRVGYFCRMPWLDWLVTAVAISETALVERTRSPKWAVF
ncbi:MAG: hypothetical protein ACFB0G_03580 [Leptolyngbyaceae cyanobacterium]